MIRKALNKIIDILLYRFGVKRRKEIYVRCERIIKNKLNRVDIKEIGFISQSYFTQENFNKIKQAVETDTLKYVIYENIDYYSDLMWGYQVILADNTSYILIFDDVYQDPYDKPQEYMALRYFHEIKTSIKLEKNHIVYTKSPTSPSMSK